MHKSENYYYMEALVSRLLADDVDFIKVQEKYYRILAGISGEEKLHRVLADYHFKDDATILYNFECVNEKGFSHEIDAIVLTTRFLLIIEVKQISGTLFYKPLFHEFARLTEEGVLENFPNPFDQAFRHQLFLSHQLSKWSIQLPVLYIVVNANIRTKLDQSLNNSPIIHLSGMPLFLEKLYANHHETSVDLEHLKNKLKSLSCRLPPKMKVESHRLRKGVLCVKCQFQNVMYYHFGLWICSQCGEKNKDAIYLALHQYRILINDRITNRELREFVGIESKAVASKLLKRLKLKQLGSGRGVYYLIPDDILERRI
ncbi:NERD domain-containing protein [Solibacillus sp. A46]|uniref:NERD domain-containing protein n=1 Tax=Solibacillus faecavium TaxID=2762221 RepID=A0ABR8XUX5_9BACL|nr:nuclease-related domain-containing protein [Solibacillus faecavium]MBD8035742.1 NERD domain-containing protein [Solibacillus faecavium]